jgi:hypothetical protein
MVEQKTKYTKEVLVKSKAVTLRQKEIEDLKHAGFIIILSQALQYLCSLTTPQLLGFD